MKIFPDTQSLCLSAPGDDLPLINLTLQVTKDLSLLVQVDCGASNNFARRQSREAERLNFVKHDIPITRMTERLATGASITDEKRVVGIQYM